MYFQGRIPDKSLARRCKWCKKWQPTAHDYKQHREICAERPKDE